MSTKTAYICNFCDKEFKFDHTGGKTPSATMDWFEYPAPHFRLTDTVGDVYDFDTKSCLIMWLNGTK